MRGGLCQLANTAETLRNSLLSATQIYELTGWPDQLILDYLTIIQNFIDLAETIDDNESTLSIRVSQAEQLIQQNSELTTQLIGKVQALDKVIGGIDSTIEQILNSIDLLNQLVQNNATAISVLSGQLMKTNKRVAALEQLATL